MCATPYRDHGALTFGLIADIWAGDGADGKDRSGVMQRMLRALWLGEFERGGRSQLTMVLPGCALEPGEAADADLRSGNVAGAGMITRSGLAKVLELKGLLPALPKPREDGGGGDSFMALAELAPEAFGDLVRNAYLETLIVSRDDFARWCDDHNIARPAFWFEEANEDDEGEED